MTFEEFKSLKKGDKILGPDNQVHEFREYSDLFDDIIRVGSKRDSRSFRYESCQIYYVDVFNKKLEEILEE